MDHRIKNISQDIMKGKYLEENIPKLLSHMANQYHTYAAVRLVMKYYSFYEAYCDEGELWSEDARASVQRLNRIIHSDIIMNSGNDKKNAVKLLDELRNEVMKRMELLTSYADIFEIYEYVLNRIEYRFKEESISFDPEEFSKEVLRYIFDSQDNYIINEKIKEIVGQLPVRMTKQKYFDILKESLQAYRGTDKSTLDSYLYMLRSTAMLCPEEDMRTCYPDLWEKKEWFAGLKLKEISKDDFEKATEVLKNSIRMLENETTIFIILEEMVNEAYAIILCATYTGIVEEGIQKLEDTSWMLLQKMNNLFLNEIKEELPMEFIGQFNIFEGVQEEISYDIVMLEETLYKVDQNDRSLVESLQLDSLLNALIRTRDLLSTSIFIDFQGENEKVTVDDTLLQVETDKLISELTEVFSSWDKAIVRAVMANTLNIMPVFFQTHSEVMDYVRNAMERSVNSYEKMACVEIINQIMSE